MSSVPALPEPEPFEGVLFDFHSTLVEQGSGTEWLAAAWRHAGRQGDPDEHLGEPEAAELAGQLERIWATARDVDPGNQRDLGAEPHRAVFDELVGAMDHVDPPLAEALYRTLTDGWAPYEEAVPLLARLRARGIRTALLSNMGIDVRDVLARTGIAPLLDAVVLSGEHGKAKPDPALFRVALDLIDVPPERALMVGDTWRDDAAAAEVGVRTLILPVTDASSRGLGLVARIVGV